VTDAHVPRIEGEVLYVKYDSSDRGTAWIDNASLEVQAGRMFLVGTPVYFNNSTPVKESFCIAWDSVKSYFVFDSVQHCRDSRENWTSSKKKSPWWRRS